MWQLIMNWARKSDLRANLLIGFLWASSIIVWIGIVILAAFVVCLGIDKMLN